MFKEKKQIKDVKSLVSQTITLCGFVHMFRDQGNIKFLLLRDITGIIQVVILKNHEDIFNTSKGLTLESVVLVEGLVKEAKQAPDGVEIECTKLEILSKADANLPIPVVVEKSGEETSTPTRFDYRWIDLRKSDKSFIFKVWTELEAGFREYLLKEGYMQFYSPSFMKNPSESGAEVFELKYFETKAYLAQSPQFYKQMAMASGFEKVFCTGAIFRAEPSFTTRHMTEFTGWDLEVSYIDSHYDVMAEEEKAIVSAYMRVKETLMPDLEIPVIPFPKITMKEAKEKLKKAGVKSEKDFDVTPEEERKLCEIIKAETGSDFVFLTDWPAEGRAFYHMRSEENKDLTKSFDLLYKGQEVTTGAQREHRYDVLKKQAQDKGLYTKELEDNYLAFFKYGCPPHGGIGHGPGRMVMGLLGLSSVKEATFLPRDVKRLSP